MPPPRPQPGAPGAPRPAADQALNALGDANRRAIVELLSAGAHSVQELADQLPISRPAVSRHLRLLKGAGLVADRKQGTRRVYELRAEGVDAIRDYFAATWGEAVTRFRLVAENIDPGNVPGEDHEPSESPEDEP